METGEKDNNPIKFNKEKTFQRQISALEKKTQKTCQGHGTMRMAFT